MRTIRAATAVLLFVPLAIAGTGAQAAPVSLAAPVSSGGPASAQAAPISLGGSEGEVPDTLRSGEFVTTVAPDESEVEPDLSHFEALRADAEEYAKEYGVSADEAYKRLVNQTEMAALREELAEQFPESYAGSHTEHGSHHRMVVHLTPAAEQPAAQSLVDRSPVAGDVELVFDAPLNAKEIVELVQEADVSAVVTGEVEGVGYDMARGALVADVRRRPGQARRPASDGTPEVVGAELSSGRRVVLPVVENVVRSAAADSYRGGLTTTDCTLGFNVVVSGTRGVTTSAHCNNTQSYKDFGSSSWVPLTFQGEVKDQVADLQWHTSPVTPGWAFYGSSTTFTTVVTGRVLRTAQAGDHVCHRGARTGYSCGTVTSTTYAPRYDGACGGSGSCFPVFSKVEGTFLRCYGGDSGGVVFSGGLAYGWFKGASTSGTTAADCDFAFYMTPDYVGRIGGSILVRP